MTVTVGGTTSSAGEIWSASFGMLIVPSTFNGTTITFTVADHQDGHNAAVTPTYYALKNESGTDISVTCAASTALAIPSEIMGAGLFKIVCGSTQTTTDTVFTLILKG